MDTVAKDEIEIEIGVKITEKEYEHIKNMEGQIKKLQALADYRYMLLKIKENKITDTYTALLKVMQHLSL